MLFKKKKEAFNMRSFFNVSDGSPYAGRLSDLECEKCSCKWIFESPLPGMFKINDKYGGE